MSDARLKRLTELARRVWPDRNVSAVVGDGLDEIGAGIIGDADDDWSQLVVVENHPRALDALEAALAVLAGEPVGLSDFHSGLFESMRHNVQRTRDFAGKQKERADIAEARLAQATAVLEAIANASPDATCGSLTAVTDSCSYWAQALAQKLVKS